MPASLQALSDDLDVDRLIKDEIDNILLQFEIEASKSIIENIEIRIATDVAMNKIRRLVKLATYSHDGFIDPADKSSNFVLEKSEPNSEPAPLSIDHWARGTVIVKKLEAPSDFYDGITSTPRSMMSTSSMRSSVSGNSFRSRRSSGRPGTRTSSSQSKSKFSTHSARSSPSNRSGKTAEIIDPVGKIFSLDGEKPFQDPLSKEFNKLMRMQQKAKQSKESQLSPLLATSNPSAVSKLLASTASNRLPVKSQKAEVRVKKERVFLPSRTVPVKSDSVNIGTEKSGFDKTVPVKTGADKPLVSSAEKDRQAHERALFKAKKLELSVDTRVSVDDKKENSDLNQKQLVDNLRLDIKTQSPANTSIDIAVSVPGQTTRVGSNSIIVNPNKSPVQPQSFPPSISPQQPQSFDTSSPQNQQLDKKPIRKLSAALKNDQNKDNNNQLNKDVKNDARGLNKGASALQPSSTLSQPSQTSLGDSLASGSLYILPASMKLQFQEIDMFEGSRKKTKPPQQNDKSNSRVDSEDKEDDRSLYDRKNVVFPSKASPKQLSNTRLLFGGKTNPRPKDRDFVSNMKSPNELRKLPPPPLGMTTGHGIVNSNSLVNLVSSQVKESFPIEGSISDKSGNSSGSKLKNKSGTITIARPAEI